MKNSTDAMKDSRVLDYVNMVKLPSSFIYLFPRRQIANFENYASNMFKMIILAASFTLVFCRLVLFSIENWTLKNFVPLP